MPFPPVVLFCPGKSGKARDATFEPLLVEQAVEKLVARCVDPSMKDLAYSTYYADETKVGEIVLEAQTVPFLAERRVVLVRNAERFGAETGMDALLEYLASPCEMTVFIMVASSIDKRTKFFKACEKTAIIVESPMLGEREAGDWIRETARAQGKNIEHGAIQEIVRRTGAHLSDIKNALTNVINFLGDAEQIREADVIAACADVAEEEVWALTDAIARSEPGAALISLRKLINLGRHEDELIGTINWLLKSAYFVASAKSGAAPVSPFVAKKVAPLSDKLGYKKLRDALVLCTDTQFMTRTTGVDSTLAIELLVVKLAAPVRRAQAASDA
jgi:DNA polymerase-3 subunit delta